MTTLIFGAAGFVGLNIVETLLQRGEAVRAFDVTPLPEAAAAAFRALPGSLEVVTADVRDPAAVRAAVEGAGAVLYGAAVTAGAARDAAEPELILGVNLDGYLNVLRAARDAGAGRVVNLSSAGAFGRAAYAHPVLGEGTMPDPDGLYSLTKFASERMTERLADLWGIDAVSVRLSGVFGRWERKTSVRDTPSPPFQVMRAALEGRPAILERPGGRDWTYAPDVAAGVLAVARAERLRHRLYHVSTGTMWTVLDWGKALARAFPGFECRLAAPGERATIDLYAPLDRGPLDVSRIFADTGFSAAFDMARSAEDYVAFVRGPGAGY